MRRIPLCAPVLAALAFAQGAVAARAGDQPQWGRAWSRNMVSEERALPDQFDPDTGKNIKWSARLGTETHSTPVIAGGRIYIGTNNGEPRDPKHAGDRGVLMCFDEKTGNFLWQLVVPKREEDPYFDWPKCGISSPATVEGDRVYIVSNRGELICLDARGMADGNDGLFRDEAAHMTPLAQSGAAPRPVSGTEISPRALLHSPQDKLLEAGPLDADILWVYDLVSGAGIWPHDAAHSSILIHGDHLYLNSGTGVDNTHKRIRAPDAPSLVVFDKRNGRLIARDDEKIAPRIFHATWSAPSLGVVDGRPLVFFSGGDGILYAFEPVSGRVRDGADRASAPSSEVAKLKKVWQFDFDPAAPKEHVHRYNTNRREGPSNIYGMPVFHGGRVFAAGGGDLFWGKTEAWLKCVDATRTGDLTTNGSIWSYRLEKHVMSTPAVYEGLVFIADCGRKIHCLDAKNGQAHWTHEIKGEAWASPWVADGKVYLGTRGKVYYVFAASKEKQLLSEIELPAAVSATTTAANGVLYVATMTHLYAVQRSAR